MLSKEGGITCQTRKKVLLALSIDVSDVEFVGRYTNPRTYGVYRVTESAPGSRRFRFGNHPVREWELSREFGNISCVVLFAERTHAKELTAILNHENRDS
jgi:hypothetical protein